MPLRFRADPVSGIMTALPAELSGSFDAAGTMPLPYYEPSKGSFTFSVHGDFIGEIGLERMVDSTTGWMPVTGGPGGDPLAWKGAGFHTVPEPEARAVYRVVCRGLDSGTAHWRLMQSAGDI